MSSALPVSVSPARPPVASWKPLIPPVMFVAVPREIDVYRSRVGAIVEPVAPQAAIKLARHPLAAIQSEGVREFASREVFKAREVDRADRPPVVGRDVPLGGSVGPGERVLARPADEVFDVYEALPASRRPSLAWHARRQNLAPALKRCG